MRITNKVAKWIVIIYTIVVSVIIFSLPVEAKEFPELSQEAKEKYITNLTDRISKELELQTTPKLYFYSCEEWPVIASYYDGLNYIYVNIGAITSYEEAVKTMAHEVRHSYQYEHQNDDSDYGKACYNGINNYNSWYKDIGAYYSQWLEQDANDYANQYMERYFK